MISIELISHLEKLINEQRDLAAAIRKEAHSIWVPGINPEEDEKVGELYATKHYPELLSMAIDAITSIEYRDGQHGLETQKQKGVILIGPESLELADQINETKLQLGTEFSKLRKQLSKNTSIRDAIEQQEAVRKILSRAGIVRLCVKQAKRQLPAVHEAPHRISWLEKRSTSIKRISVSEAESMLKKLNSEQAAIDLQQLSSLSSSTSLAIVQKPNSPTHKATIYYPCIKDGARAMENKQIHAPVPILCATGNVMPSLHKGGSRQNTPRTDQLISQEVFLPSIRAHLYSNASAA